MRGKLVPGESCCDLSATLAGSPQRGGSRLFLLIRLPQRTTAALSRYQPQHTEWDYTQTYTHSSPRRFILPTPKGPCWLSPRWQHLLFVDETQQAASWGDDFFFCLQPNTKATEKRKTSSYQAGRKTHSQAFYRWLEWDVCSFGQLK